MDADENVLKAAFDRWADMPPVVLGIPRGEIFAIALACQYISCHPGFTDEMGIQFRELAEQFTQIVSDDPDVYVYLEKGYERLIANARLQGGKDPRS